MHCSSRRSFWVAGQSCLNGPSSTFSPTKLFWATHVQCPNQLETQKIDVGSQVAKHTFAPFPVFRILLPLCVATLPSLAFIVPCHPSQPAHQLLSVSATL
eukprot:EG_transcript_60608